MNFDPVLLLYIPVFLFSLTVHECAHAWSAHKGGDKTSTYMGRLTLNPIAHIDPIGTILLPLIALFTGAPLFGWAKPVPVNEMRLPSPKWLVYVSLAGPASNLTLVFISALVLRAAIIFGGPSAILDFLGDGNPTSLPAVLFLLGRMFIQVNFALAIFNMIPVPPLDGSSLIYHYFIRHNYRWQMIWFQLTRSGVSFIILYFLVYHFAPLRMLLTFAYTRPVDAVFRWIMGV